MRSEFSKRTKRDAFVRAAGKCECCGARLSLGKFDYDHIIPDGMGGDPTLENCQVACRPCHKIKTSTLDIPAIAKTKRIQDREMGIRKGPQIKSAGFRKAPPQNSASRAVNRPRYI